MTAVIEPSALIAPLDTAHEASEPPEARGLARDLDVDRLPAFAIDLKQKVAQIEAEVVAGESLPAEDLVGVGQGRQQVVEVVVVGDDDAGGAVGLIQCGLQWRPRLGKVRMCLSSFSRT